MRVAIDEACVVKLGGVRHGVRLLDITVAGARIRLPAGVAVDGTGTLVLGRAGAELEAAFAVRSRPPDGSIGLAFETATLSAAFVRQVEVMISGKRERAA
jgi:hypothetical protein